MEKTIEARLTSLARRIFVQYQSQLEPVYVHQLDEAIRICETYQQGVGNWGDLYEVVLGDDGIWEYSEGAGDFSEELRTMWVLETCILICSCWLGCRKSRTASQRIWNFVERISRPFWTSWRDCRTVRRTAPGYGSIGTEISATKCAINYTG